jgi:hypothetical protein
MSYFEKYLKYKSKYLRLKQLLNNESQNGGGKKDILEIDALSDTPTNLEAFGIDMEDFPYFPKFTGGGNNENKDEEKNDKEDDKEDEEDDEEENKEKKTINIKSDSEVSDSEVSEDEESEDEESEDENSENDSSEFETDSVLSSSDEEQDGGGFFGNLMDELSSSVKSFDLQKGGYDGEDDEELSPLSDEMIMKL